MTATLAGKRILIVEDEYYIASDLKRALQQAGAVVIGPAPDLERGLALTAGDAADAAVLDVNLEGTRSYPIAEALAARSIPFLFVTGYDGWALPEPFRSAPRLSKPFATDALIDCLADLVDQKVKS